MSDVPLLASLPVFDMVSFGSLDVVSEVLDMADLALSMRPDILAVVSGVGRSL